jgi:hypothetical protein
MEWIALSSFACYMSSRPTRRGDVRTFRVEVLWPIEGCQALVHDDVLIAQLVLVDALLKQQLVRGPICTN